MVNGVSSYDGSSVKFKYYYSSDSMEYAPEISNMIPCTAVIQPFLANLQMGAKVCPEDIKRLITFFDSSHGQSRTSYSYIRFLGMSGDYRWFQFMLNHNDADEGCAEGQLVCIDDVSVDAEIREYSGRAAFFARINEAVNEIPLYDVANLMMIKLTDFRAMSGSGNNEEAARAAGEVADIIRTTLRNTDLIGFVENDTIFAFLTGLKDEKILCDKASSIISAIKVSWSMYRDKTTVASCIGIATVPHNASLNFAILYDKAVQALDAAISRNKNTYVLYSDSIKNEEQFVGRNVSLHDIELVKNVLDPLNTWAYAVDERLHLIYKNSALTERVPGECIGYCYQLIKGQKQQCLDCPLKKFENDMSSLDSDVYSPGMRRVLHCRTTRLVMRNNIQVYIVADMNEDISRQMLQLQDSMQHFNKAMLKLQDIIWEIDIEKNTCTRIREAHVFAMTEKRVEDYEKLRRYYLDHVVYPEDREDFIYSSDPGYLREALKIGREMVERKVRMLYQDGTYHWYSVDTILDKDVVFLLAHDINELNNDIVKQCMVDKKYEQILNYTEFQNELAQNYERSEHVNELTGIYVFEYNVPDRSYYVCTTFEKMFHIDESMKTDEWSLLEGIVPFREDREKYKDFIRRVRTEPDTHEITLRLMNKFDVALWFTITVQTLKGLNNTLTRVTGCIQDVNSEMEIKAELEFRADYDSITGLYNSESFYRKTMERIFLKSDLSFAIVSVDIDRFRIINDRFGVETGNRCLKELGQVIHDSLPWDGIAGRYQADVFSILFDYKKDQDILDYIEKIGMAFHFDEASRCGSTLSFGIYKITDRDIPVRLMCDRARLAKKEIKGNTLTNFAVYDNKIRIQQRNLAEMESEMQIALDRHEFVMYLQPKIDLKTEKICGAEALVRWQHPTKGLRLPGDFLPLFESNGFVKKLDQYMWESAAIYLAKLKELGLSVPISVNISRLHINNTDLVKVLTDLTKRYNIEPSQLELEITETLFTENTEGLYKTMTELKEHGFIIEMDDFGSGYSSLNMLKDAPVDVIKIDRFFIDEIITTRRGRIIIENSVSMSRQLGMTVVAEGVETREQVDFLKSIDCDVVQGYYYSKPVPVTEFEKMLKQQI